MKIKTLLPILFITLFFVSCKKEKKISIETRMLIDHYQPAGMDVFMPNIFFLTQTGSYIGTNKWQYESDRIYGFDYEPGYVYDLNILIETIPNPPADGSSIRFILKKVNAKTKVAAGTTFDLVLKSPNVNYTSGDATTGFKLAHQTVIDCGTLCTELSQALTTNNKTVVGTFTHKADKSYLLTKLDVK